MFSDNYLISDNGGKVIAGRGRKGFLGCKTWEMGMKSISSPL